MLAVSPVRRTTKDEKRTVGGRGQEDVEVAVAAEAEEEDIIQTCEFTISPEDDFPEFADSGNLLDSIDFDDLFCGMDSGDSLPDLEIDPEILNGDLSDQMNASSTEKIHKGIPGKGEQVVSKRDENDKATKRSGGGEKKRKYSSKNNNNNNQGKRKVKVYVNSS